LDISFKKFQITPIIEKSLDLLIKDNDRAAEYILGGDIPNALSILEKMEKLMEV